MLNLILCDACRKRSTEVEQMIPLKNITVCNECVVVAARQVGILPNMPLVTPIPLVEARPPGSTSFTFVGEIEGHLNQTYDTMLREVALVMLRASYPDVAIDLIRVERLDDCSPDVVAEGRARYQVELLIRSKRPISQHAWRIVLTQRWSELTSTHNRLLSEKGTRDLVEPKLMGLIGYLISRAAQFRRRNGAPQD